jgi:DNA-binding MarR family transcriptional regulator
MTGQRADRRAIAAKTSGHAELIAQPEGRHRPGAPNWAGLRLHVVDLRIMTPLYNKLQMEHGLFRDEAAIIVCLSITAATTAQQVIRYTGRPRNSISRAVISLEERGLILRSAHPADGRASVIELTSAGQDLFTAIKGDYAAADERLLSTLEPDERAMFAELLAKVTAVSADWT